MTLTCGTPAQQRSLAVGHNFAAGMKLAEQDERLSGIREAEGIGEKV